MADRLETVDEIVKYAVVSNPVKAKSMLALAPIFVVFAIIGIWIPGGGPHGILGCSTTFLFHFQAESCLDGP